MGKIVAIGGGCLDGGETLSIDREIVRLTKKRKPKALFVPTASDDPPDYYDAFRSIYEKRLGCQAEPLFLIRSQPNASEIKRKILSADLIYVGGGNTLRMMRVWKRLGVDKLLARAYGEGTVLCGLSAGALCWFEWGHSDSMSYYNPKNWDYIRVRGLGFIKALGCPHYRKEGRIKSFEVMVAKYNQLGLALDDGAALIIEDGLERVVTSKRDARAYRVFKENGKVVTEIL